MLHRLAYPLFFLLLFSSLPGAAETTPYRDELKESATKLRLPDDRYWHVLLHYKPGLFGTESLVDDPKFFLSPEGKHDPSAELNAAIDGLFAGGLEEQTIPRCRFPARYDWLIRRLTVDLTRLPEVSCPTLEEHRKRIDAKSASLIFASGHMNAPASMFGHTFLRFDSSYESPLLSYAVNYAAQIDRNDNGLVYAVKGIFGLYPGYFSILPYYDKVKEYGNMDQRDLWEYRLNFTEEEVQRMVLHVLELQGIYSDYFFFKENCSYDLLFVLEIAAPTATLTDRFHRFTIPIDTVKTVRAEGLISDPVFRPSQARKIRHIASSLDEADIGRARSVLDNTVAPREILAVDIPDADKGKILDLASEAVQLRYAKGQYTKEEYLRRFLTVLSARSTIPAAESLLTPIPAPEQPESGHESSRVALAAGIREEDPFLEVSGRPAYHDLLDADDGFTPGSQIEFSRATVRYYPDTGRFRLQEWDLVHILSLAGRDDFFRPVSWKFRTGFATKPFPGGSDALVFFLNPGGGMAWDIRPLGLVHVLLETEVNVAGRFNPDYTAGVGLSAGILRQMTRSWKTLLAARQMAGVLGDEKRGREFSAILRQGISLGHRRAIFLDVGRTISPGVHYNEGKFSVTFYF
ncbi:MAG: DUF4105 domain-containing protein [Deltaproteobacteria bacterium]|nr:DUF4105 domain-containing protein [Deltaproteobacteria bacterium]